MLVFNSIKNKTPLVLILFCSCTKNNLNEPQETQIVKSEIIDLSSSNNLNTALSPAQWNLSQTQKITYSNGWINYISQGLKDRTKSFVKYTKDNKKFVEAIATDTISKYGTGYSYHVLRTLTGLRYHSFDVRIKDMAINNGIVERELPLYTLVAPVFSPIGTPGPAEEDGRLFSCLKSRLKNCSWRCTLSCMTVTISSSSLCSLMIVHSCFPF